MNVYVCIHIFLIYLFLVYIFYHVKHGQSNRETSYRKLSLLEELSFPFISKVRDASIVMILDQY